MEIYQLFDIGKFLSRCSKERVPAYPFTVKALQYDEYLNAALMQVRLTKLELELCWWIDVEGMALSGMTPMPYLPIWLSEYQVDMVHSFAAKKELGYLMWYYLEVQVGQSDVTEDAQSTRKWQLYAWHQVLEWCKDPDFLEWGAIVEASPINVQVDKKPVDSLIKKLSQRL